MRHRVLVTLLCVFTLRIAAQTPASATGERAEEIQQIRAELARLSARLDALEHNGGVSNPASAPVKAAAPTPAAALTPEAAVFPTPPGPAAPTAPPPVLTAADTPTLGFFRTTTLNVNFDGYYGYNFNAPVGRVNLLRAYDVTSNSFSLNQADLIVERLPTSESRFGGRFDLMFGQATETLQGSGANEQRPEVWRNVFQAYGSYLAPLGSGLQMDFGKFASSLGNEGNYTKDQIAYSRGFLFNYLPFYHMGLRANYNLTPKVNVAYWLVNGTQQTEDFNGFKSQAFLFTLQPAKALTWNVNYYFGQEARDVEPTLYPGIPTAPTQPGLPTVNISPAPSGREHIFDTYATWQATPKFKLVGEADYVLNRSYPEQQPPRVALGALELQYTLPHSSHLGGRAEYLDDRGGLFSGRTQSLKEITVVADHLFAPGFLARAEYRRDWSNQRFFLTDTAGALVTGQTTATLGLVFWWGTKAGSW